MSKQSPELTRPIITIFEDPDLPAAKVQIDIPGKKLQHHVTTLNLAIAILRVLDQHQAYVNDQGTWYVLEWGPVLSPWEGPEI